MKQCGKMSSFCKHENILSKSQHVKITETLQVFSTVFDYSIILVHILTKTFSKSLLEFHILTQRSILIL